MSKRNTPESIKASIRNEVKAELSNALLNRIEQGTVVTSNGDTAAFSVEYHTWHLTTGTKHGQCITIKGHRAHSVREAASVMMSEWDYTR